jgi:hypothetical protein
MALVSQIQIYQPGFSKNVHNDDNGDGGGFDQNVQP